MEGGGAERDLRRTRGQRLSRERFVFSIGEGTKGERARHCAAAALRLGSCGTYPSAFISRNDVNSCEERRTNISRKLPTPRPLSVLCVGISAASLKMLNMDVCVCQMNYLLICLCWPSVWVANTEEEVLHAATVVIPTWLPSMLTRGEKKSPGAFRKAA